jgi:hypothetical protein
MRTSGLALLALALVASPLAAAPAPAPVSLRAAPPGSPPAPRSPLRFFEFGLWPEVTLVGLAGGARAELLYRPFGPGSATRLRLAPGFLEGPEFHYVPIALGYRAVFRSTRIVRPLIGTGLEYQLRWVDDGPAAHQLAWYGETGLLVALRPDLSLGAVGALDFTFVGGPGPGIVCRLGLTWSPSERPAPGAAALRP